MKDSNDQEMREKTVGGRQVLLFLAVWAVIVLGGLYMFIQYVFWH